MQYPAAKRLEGREQRLGKAMLTTSAIGAARTLNAWRPAGRSGRVANIAFRNGLTVSELPMHSLAWQALATGGFVASGAHRTRAGRAGLALTAVSFCGLAGLSRAAGQAAEALEQALVEGLGADYRAEMDRAFAPREEAAIMRRQVVNPLPPLRRRYVQTRDVAYGEFGVRNHLDIWRRDDLPDDARAPVIIQVHGGAWMSGSKEQQAVPLMGHFAERGWVSVAVNYRLAPTDPWPAQIVDVKRAIAWVKEHVAEHGGDPEFVVITGGSAGGHLATLAALTPGVSDFQPGFEDADTRVQAVVPMYGVYDLTNRDNTGRSDMEDLLSRNLFEAPLDEAREVWDRASPMSWVAPDAPPFFIAHGANDTLVPVAHAQSFARLLAEVSEQPVVYAELPCAQHGFDLFSSVRSLHTVRAVDRFLAVVRTRAAQRASQRRTERGPSPSVS